jgi:hypothetical protein
LKVELPATSIFHFHSEYLIESLRVWRYIAANLRNYAAGGISGATVT